MTIALQSQGAGPDLVQPQSAVSVPVTSNPRVRKLVLVVGDLLAVVMGLTAAYLLRSGVGSSAEAFILDSYVRVALLSLPVWTAVFARYHLYNARHISARIEEWDKLVH